MADDQQLIVDGRRDAVSWVTGLPREWTSSAGRLILMVLACDAYQDVSRPGGEALARWTGLLNGKLYRELAYLMTGDALRPPLLEKVDRQGRPVNRDSRLGRERTGYRLRTELSNHAEQLTLQGVGRDTPRGNAAHSPDNLDSYSPARLDSNSPSNSPGNSPGPLEAPFSSLNHDDDEAWLHHLAAEVRQRRLDAGHAEWHLPGTVKKLRELASTMPRPQLRKRALAAATNPACKTPGAIGQGWEQPKIRTKKSGVGGAATGPWPAHSGIRPPGWDGPVPETEAEASG